MKSKFLTEWILWTHWLVLIKEIPDSTISPIEVDIKSTPIPGHVISFVLWEHTNERLRVCLDIK